MAPNHLDPSRCLRGRRGCTSRPHGHDAHTSVSCGISIRTISKLWRCKTMLRISFQFFAHKKGGGSTKNGRDSESKRLGVKRADGQFVPGRQHSGSPERHAHSSSAPTWASAANDTLFALVDRQGPFRALWARIARSAPCTRNSNGIEGRCHSSALFVSIFRSAPGGDKPRSYENGPRFVRRGGLDGPPPCPGLLPAGLAGIGTRFRADIQSAPTAPGTGVRGRRTSSGPEPGGLMWASAPTKRPDVNCRGGLNIRPCPAAGSDAPRAERTA